MLKRVLTLCCALWLATAVVAQTDSVYYGRSSPAPKKKNEQPKADWTKKVNFGGNFQIWPLNPTFILLTPYASYAVTDQFQVGVGALYNRISWNQGSAGKFSQTVYGPHTFARYTFAQKYFLQVQFDRLCQPQWSSVDPNDKQWINYLMVGGGFCHAINSKVFFLTYIMYNVKASPYSIYPSPLMLQFGFAAGL